MTGSQLLVAFDPAGAYILRYKQSSEMVKLFVELSCIHAGGEVVAWNVLEL